MASDQFSVSWDNFHKIVNSGINSLLENEDFIDVTLAVEGRYLKAHKLVLSVCSSYFRELFKTSPCKHPIVFMKDATYSAMSDLLQFMYKGEVQVNEENFNTFIKTAEALQIRGISNYDNASAKCDTESANRNTKLMESEVPTSKNSLVQETRQPSPIPATKRLRLDDHTAPVHDETVKTEEIMVEESAVASSSNDELIFFKAEPYEEEGSSFGIGDDDSNENSFDDPLDKTNPIRTENDWVMEGDDDIAEVDTKHEILFEEEANEDDLEDYGHSAPSLRIPEKSKRQYESCFDIFEQWCIEKNVNDIDEKILIRYFKEKSINLKPTSLVTHYSILRTMLSIKKNMDISSYRNLLSFLKTISKGYKSKKSLDLESEHIENFLRQANDNKFLLMKVITIFYVAGSTRWEELQRLEVKHVIDEGNCIRVKVPDARNMIIKEFLITGGSIENVNLVEIIRKYINLRPSDVDHQRFFVSFQQGQCTKQTVGINKYRSVAKIIAQCLGLANPKLYTARSFRKISRVFTVVPRTANFLFIKN